MKIIAYASSSGTYSCSIDIDRCDWDHVTRTPTHPLVQWSFTKMKAYSMPQRFVPAFPHNVTVARDPDHLMSGACDMQHSCQIRWHHITRVLGMIECLHSPSSCPPSSTISDLLSSSTPPTSRTWMQFSTTTMTPYIQLTCAWTAGGSSRLTTYGVPRSLAVRIYWHSFRNLSLAQDARLYFIVMSWYVVYWFSKELALTCSGV